MRDVRAPDQYGAAATLLVPPLRPRVSGRCQRWPLIAFILVQQEYLPLGQIDLHFYQ